MGKRRILTTYKIETFASIAKNMAQSFMTARRPSHQIGEHPFTEISGQIVKM